MIVIYTFLVETLFRASPVAFDFEVSDKWSAKRHISNQMSKQVNSEAIIKLQNLKSY